MFVSTTALQLRLVSPAALDYLRPALVELLREVVNDGFPLGFLAPLEEEQARHYWISLRPELLAGTRMLVAASIDDRIVGTGQLALSPWPNAHHRAELQKVFVSPSARRQGVGRALMEALHQVARRRGRTLLLLNTRRGAGAEDFYRGLGYEQVGITPGYSLGSGGERYDTVSFYKELRT